MKIIGINGMTYDKEAGTPIGSAGAGKDTAAKFFVDQHGYVIVALADELKRTAMRWYGFSETQLWGPSIERNMPDKRYHTGLRRYVYPHCPEGAVWIPLHNERGFTLIDVAHFESIMRYRWTLNKKEEGKSTDYVRAPIDGKKVMLHRFIKAADAGDDLVVDHVNGDGLDNREANLRVCRKEDNQRNAKKREDGASPFKGVGWVPDRLKWRAFIRVDGEQKTLGYFDREEEAALAYDHAASKAFGVFARLNSDMFLTPRRALQVLGTEVGRLIYAGTWVNTTLDIARELIEGAGGRDGVERTRPGEWRQPGYAAALGLVWSEAMPSSSAESWHHVRRVSKTGGIVIPDVRFKNEIDAIRAAGGYLIRVRREMPGLGGDAGKHKSETEQLEIADEEFDALLNNTGTIPQLGVQVDQVVERVRDRERRKIYNKLVPEKRAQDPVLGALSAGGKGIQSYNPAMEHVPPFKRVLNLPPEERRNAQPFRDQLPPDDDMEKLFPPRKP